MNKNTKLSGSNKFLIAFLFMVQFTNILDFVIMMPLGPKIMRAFAITPKEFAYVVSAYGFSAALSAIIGSFFIDLFDRKKALLVLYCGFALGTIACGLAPNHLALIVARIIAGAFGGIMGGHIFSIIGDNIREEHRGKATGAVMSAFGFASVVGVPVGLALAEKWGWHTPFLALGILCCIVFLLLNFKLPALVKSTRDKKNKIAHFKEVISQSNHQRAFILSIFIILSGFMVIPFISPYMVRNVGLLEKNLPYMYFIGGLCTLVTSNLIGRMSDQIGKHKTFYIIGSISLLPILLLTSLMPVSLFWVLCATTPFFIFVSGRFVPLMALITSSVAPQYRGSFMILNSAVQSIGMGLATILSGLILSSDAQGRLIHYNYVGYLSCSITLFCFYLASRVKVFKS